MKIRVLELRKLILFKSLEFSEIIILRGYHLLLIKTITEIIGEIDTDNFESIQIDF